MKLMNAIPINPVINIVMPKPLRGSGTFEYLSFSLIAARAIMAKKKPIPVYSPQI